MKQNRLLEDITLPFYGMGNVTSADLYCANEQAVFDFYWLNRDNYRKACDFGANIGLHTIFMTKLGWDVRSFEPDAEHAEEFKKNMALNEVECDFTQAAVSYRDSAVPFVRVMGNTSGNHILGAKDNVYGDVERVLVKTIDAKTHVEWADLIKMDIEGHEADVICALPPDIWRKHHLIVEIGSEKNAQRIHAHLHGWVPIYSLKEKRSVVTIQEMPKSHHDGNLFIWAV